MAKIQNISEIHPTLGFTEFDILGKNTARVLMRVSQLHSVFQSRRPVVGRRNIFSPSQRSPPYGPEGIHRILRQALVEHLNGNIYRFSVES